MTTTTQPSPTLPRNDHTGLSDSTHSSTTTSSAERYRLDDTDSRPVLLYRYRGKLTTSSQREICAELDKDTLPPLRCTSIPIPRGTSYLEIKRHDLYLPEEKDDFAQYPNFDASLAAVKVPLLPYLSRLLLGSYDELYIVSPETTPSGSLAGSQEGSRRLSPTASWEGEGQES
ncbi:hypothetical protein LTR62_000783 [Meristemomyces frigidus]|uniref:Uncharacterized protein n=1 Tax=Meristemomyces frigidus TaxID=1508187 RepID=A0AAN7TTC8_9PEZI|nr:hypothetical protein LTR62_000783 [Meristemomyces frigidus]